MKTSLDWFKLDVHLDEKFQLIEAEYGLKGFAVIVKLLQKIYGGNGYYCEWTDEVALLFSRKECGEGGNVVSEIVATAVARGIFDRDLYARYHILTSCGIQKRYLEAVNRRKDFKIKDEYLLVRCAQNPEDVNISSKNVNISSKNVDIPKQIREEKRREDTPPNPLGGKDRDFARFWEVYPKKTAKAYARKAFDKVKVSVDVLISAVEKQKTSLQWTKDGGQYIPNPATWLNQGRWGDELSPSEMKPKYM